MIVDDATLMAYSDGELDAVTQKRVERAMANDPTLAGRAAAFAALTVRVRGDFDPIAQASVPDRLKATLTSNVVAIRPKQRPLAWLAIAASLVLGIGLGTRLGGETEAPFAVRSETVVAAGTLGHALDTQLASDTGDIRVLVSFRGPNGYCRVFSAKLADGIACRNGGAWQLRQTRSGTATTASAYRQASASDAVLMAAAQDMMIGAPLDAAAEYRARATGWR